jgi:hypothetical protein
LVCNQKRLFHTSELAVEFDKTDMVVGNERFPRYNIVSDQDLRLASMKQEEYIRAQFMILMRKECLTH